MTWPRFRRLDRRHRVIIRNPDRRELSQHRGMVISERQPDLDRCPHRSWYDADAATMGPDHRINDRQAQPRTTTAPGRVAAPEPLENRVANLAGDSWSVVVDGNQGLAGPRDQR